MIAAFAAGLVELVFTLLCVAMGLVFVATAAATALVLVAFMVVDLARGGPGGDNAKHHQR